jgi:putative transposase
MGVMVAASTVWEILKASGIDPARRRTGPTWSQFLRSQAEAILACDFFSVDLLDGTQAYVLAVIEHASRRVRILGATPHPTKAWTAQQARNLIMDLGEHAHRVKFMIRDRGPNFTAAFDAVLADAGIRTVLCNVRTPRMNAIVERWIGDAAASSWTAPSCGTSTICGGSCANTRPITISTGLTAPCTQPRR